MYIREGGYMDYPTATTVAYDLGRDRTLSLLAHEGWHQYVAGHFLTPLPAWLDEGLACQWEAFDLKGGIPVFTPHNNYFRRNNLRETGDWDAGVWIPLKHLLSMNAGQAILQTGQTTRSFYAQVWALALFLREASPKTYGDGFRKLMADAGTERIRIVIKAYQATHTESEGVSEGEIIFRHYITEDLDTFEHDYRNFSRKLVR